MSRYIAFTDAAIEQVNSSIDHFFPAFEGGRSFQGGYGYASGRGFATEQGGALLGPIGSDIVTQFIFDRNAQRTSCTYSPSSSLLEKIHWVEENEPMMEMKGFLHSHPGGYDQPSAGDGQTLSELTMNHPWISAYLCPIVSWQVQDPNAAHVAELRLGFMSAYYAERRRQGGLVIGQATLAILPVRRDSIWLATEMEGRYLGTEVLKLNNQLQVYGEIETAELMATLVTPLGYPDTAPALMVQAKRGCGRKTMSHSSLSLSGCFHQLASEDKALSVALKWDQELPEEKRLSASIEDLLASWPRFEQGKALHTPAATVPAAAAAHRSAAATVPAAAAAHRSAAATVPTAAAAHRSAAATAPTAPTAPVPRVAAAPVSPGNQIGCFISINAPDLYRLNNDSPSHFAATVIGTGQSYSFSSYNTPTGFCYKKTDRSQTRRSMPTRRT